MDPRIQIFTKMSRIHNTGLNSEVWPFVMDCNSALKILDLSANLLRSVSAHTFTGQFIFNYDKYFPPILCIIR